MGDLPAELVVRSLVFAVIDPVAVGQNHGRQLPLHVTLVPPFTHPAQLVCSIEHAVHTVASQWRPFGAVGVGEALFGPERDVRVQRLGGVELHRLHVELCAALAALSPQVQLDDTYAGPRYSPHVTEYRGRGLAVGAQVTVGAVALASKQAGSWVNGPVVAFGPS